MMTTIMMSSWFLITNGDAVAVAAVSVLRVLDTKFVHPKFGNGRSRAKIMQDTIISPLVKDMRRAGNS